MITDETVISRLASLLQRDVDCSEVSTWNALKGLVNSSPAVREHLLWALTGDEHDVRGNEAYITQNSYGFAAVEDTALKERIKDVARYQSQSLFELADSVGISRNQMKRLGFMVHSNPRLKTLLKWSGSQEVDSFLYAFFPKLYNQAILLK